MWSTGVLEPDLVLGNTIFHLTPEMVEKQGLRGLVLDVDETLVPIRESEVSLELRQWVTEMKKVAQIYLLSNNLSHRRIRRIAELLHVPYSYGARKPSRKKLRQVIQSMNLPMQQVAMVGDRLFTDVLAGNRLGVFTILVEPMPQPGKNPRLYSLRNLEVWISQRLGISLYGHGHPRYKE